jgi:GNAT superfamily N-acetyltransferase
MLGVHDGYKGRRTGPHLLKFALGQAILMTHDIGCRFLVADVNSADPAAIKMYTEFGFEAAGHERYGSSAKRGQPRYFYDLHTDPPADLEG